MQLGDLEQKHSVELQVTLNGKTATFLTVLEQRVAHSALLSPVLLNGKIVGFPPSCNVSFIYPAQGRVYAWHGVNVKAIRYKGKAYHSVDLIGDAHTLDRRGAYRIFIGSKMKVTFFTNSGPVPKEVLIKDISETGFAFLSPEPFETGRMVRLNLDTGRGTLKLSAHIVRNQQLEDRRDVLYGCRFSSRSTSLSSYLMKLQQQNQKIGIQ